MKKGFLRLLPLLALLLLTAGCRSGRPPAQLPPVSETMSERATALAAALEFAPVRAVELDRHSFELFSGQFHQLFARLQKLAISRVYLVVDSGDFLEERRKELLELAELSASAGIELELMLPQRHFLPRRRGSVWARKLREPDSLTPMAKRIGDFNDGLPRKAKLAGVAVRAEIHLFSSGSANLPGNALYAWSEDAYGPGSDNDMLMRQLFLDLRKFREALGPGLAFSVAVPDFYHDRAVAGELSCGSVEDFLDVADQVIVSGRGNQPSVFFGSIRPELQTAGADRRILMGIYISSHAVESQTALRRRGWADFANILQYLVGEGAAYPAFGGLVLDSWRTFESLWERE